jgi:hypothetical protein
VNGKDKDKSFDLESLRPSERDVDRGLRDLAGSLKVTQDKNGDARVLGFKISRAGAFALNTLYDQVVIPWTQAGSKKLYDQVLNLARQSEHTSGQAHKIASGVSLVFQMGAIIGKPLIEIVSANGEHYKRRTELYDQVKSSIEGTGADYEKNEVIATAFGRVNAKWSRDMVRQIPDAIKIMAQGSVIYGDHKDYMRGRKTQFDLTNAGTSAPVDPHMQWFGQELDKIDAMDVSEASKQSRRNALEKALDVRRGTGEHGRQKESSPFGILTPNTPGMIGLGAEFIGIAVDDYTESMVSDTSNAWDKIQTLKRFMNEQRPEENPDRVRINGVQLKKYIIDIFQQNELDRGRGRMGQALVEQLMPAVDKIAEGIADTTIDATALVHLVGDHKILMNDNGARIFVSEEKVDEVLEGLKGVNTSKERINKEEFFSNFADPQTARDVIKTNIASFDGAEKALFVSVFPDELLAHAGMSKEAIAHERKIAHEFIYDVVVADTLQLAQQAPDELKKLGLTKKEIEAVQQLSDDIERGKEDAVKVAVDGADRTVISAIRTAALHKQIDEKGEHAEKVWTDMVKRGSSLREKIENGELRKQKSESFTERASRDEPSTPAHERELRRRSRSGDESHEALGV